MPIKPTLCFLAFLSCLALPGRIGAASGNDEVSNYEVTLLVDGRKVADTWINLSAGGTYIEIPGAPILSALAGMIDKQALSQLESQVSSSGTFSNRVLSRYGIMLTINGPKKAVILSLAKKAAAPAAVPAAKPKVDSGIAHRQQVKDDSGPWATPPMPALPGNQADSLDSVFSVSHPAAPKPVKPKAEVPAPSDAGWGPAKPDTARPNTAPKPVPVKPEIQLQSFRLDKTRDELFEEVFKRKAPPLPPSVEVTLLVDGRSYGTLWLQYNKEQKRYTFPVDPVLNALHGLVRADLFAKLTERASRQTRFTVEDLIESGFPTMLNTSVFELSTGVPAQLLGTKIHTLTPQRIDPSTVPALEPSPVSAYLNVKATQKLSYSQYNPTPYDSLGSGKRIVELRNSRNRDPAVVSLDGAANILGWVLEGRGNIWEQPEEGAVEFSRQDIRIVHDWPKQALRLTAGDLIFPTSGFQTFIKLGGAGLSRDFSLQPHMVAYPVKELEFFLAGHSEVKVYVNGVLKTTLDLEQGTHDLKGFPFTRGESEVEVVIRDDLGQTQTLNFSFIHEPNLLAKGFSAFSFNVGLPSRNVYNRNRIGPDSAKYEFLNYDYDVDHPMVFMDYRRGLSDRMTLEGYTQALDTAGLVGVNSLYALKIGKISANLAASYQGDNVMDWAGSLEYIYIPKVTPKTSPISWRFQAEYQGEGFYRPGQDRSRLGAVTLANSIQKNGRFANLNVGLSYAMRPDSADFYSIYTGVNKNWKKGFSGNLAFKNTFDRRRSTGTSVSMTVTYFFFADQQSVRASQRIENHRPDGTEQGAIPKWDYTTDLAYDYNGSAPFPKNPTLSAATSFGPYSNEYTGMAEWKGNQGYAQALLRRTEPKTSSVITNFADLSLQSSLVFADGNFAISRPIVNSFVIVKGIENEKDCDLIVNPSEVGYEGKAAPWFPGVVPNLSPYYLKKVHVDVVDPPFGSGEERSDFTLYPSYKTGYAIYMGTSATIIALGTLMLSPGVPASYQTFTATPIDGTSSREPVMGFTNGAGKFQLTRLQPGRYKIEMDVEGKIYHLVLTLPKNSSGIKSVGTLVLTQD
jgi:outer membrane usher protein